MTDLWLQSKVCLYLPNINIKAVDIAYSTHALDIGVPRARICIKNSFERRVLNVKFTWIGDPERTCRGTGKCKNKHVAFNK